VCEGCTVRAECLAYALEDEDAFAWGVWGGTSPRERRAIGRVATAAAEAPERLEGDERACRACQSCRCVVVCCIAPPVLDCARRRTPKQLLSERSADLSAAGKLSAVSMALSSDFTDLSGPGPVCIRTGPSLNYRAFRGS
jgi:hypothetical protein